MAPLTDPVLLRCYKNALKNWRFDGFIIWTEVAKSWVNANLEGYSIEHLGKLMHQYVQTGGEIDQQRETRPEWRMHDFHYDLRFPVGGQRIYFETRLLVNDPDHADDPRIHVVNCHDA